MFINEAIKKALENGCYIATGELKEVFKIEPTNEMRGCIVHSIGSQDGSTWSPTAEDLIRDDYILIP